MISTLRSEAMAFLEPWGGDYKLASKEIFNPISNNNKDNYKSQLNQILNSMWFIETVKRRKSRKEALDEKGAVEAQKILASFGINSSLSELLGRNRTDLTGIITSSIRQEEGKKQIRLDEGNLKKGMEALIGKSIEQKYYRNIDTLKK